MANPVHKVELSLDDPNVALGSATWIDISDYVIDDGIKTNRGRQSELDRFQAGTGSVLLKNRDGRFDPVNAAGPYYPNLRPMNRIRISQTWSAVSYPQMVGYTQGWPPSYPGPEHSVVNVPIVDAFSVLAIPTLQTPNPYTDDTTANLLRNGSVEADITDYIAISSGLDWFQGASLFGESSLKIITTNVTGSGARYDKDFNISVIPGKSYTASLYASLAVAASKPFTLTISFYNGASLVNSVSQNVTLTTTGWVRVMVSGVAGALTDRANIIFATNGAQGVFDAYTDGWLFEVLSANLSDLPEERSNLRIGRALDAIQWPTADRSLSSGASILLEQNNLSQVTTLAELQLIEQSENGRLWIDRSGNVKFLSRWDMGLSPYNTSQATFGQTPGVDLPYVSVTPSYDLTFIHNEIRLTGTQPNAIEQTASDSTSVGHYYTRTLSQTGLLVSDNELDDACSYELDRYATVHLRFLTLELGGMADPTNLWPQLLGRELGDRITVKFTPPGSSAITQECFIEGIAHDFSRKDRWKTTFSLSAFGIGYLIYPSGKNFFILGDTTYGKVTTGDGMLVY